MVQKKTKAFIVLIAVITLVIVGIFTKNVYYIQNYAQEAADERFSWQLKYQSGGCTVEEWIAESQRISVEESEFYINYDFYECIGNAEMSYIFCILATVCLILSYVTSCKLYMWIPSLLSRVVSIVLLSSESIRTTIEKAVETNNTWYIIYLCGSVLLLILSLDFRRFNHAKSK